MGVSCCGRAGGLFSSTLFLSLFSLFISLSLSLTLPHTNTFSFSFFLSLPHTNPLSFMTSIAQLVKASDFACTDRDPVQASAMFLNKKNYQFLISVSSHYSSIFLYLSKLPATEGNCLIIDENDPEIAGLPILAAGLDDGHQSSGRRPLGLR